MQVLYKMTCIKLRRQTTTTCCQFEI